MAKPTVTGTIELFDQTAPTYGDSISFTSTVTGKVSPKTDVFITVTCIQDGVIVYRYSGPRDFSFPLLDQVGYEWDGNAASGHAALVSWTQKGKKNITYEILDQVTFAVASQPT